jgi:hypothetical protein
MKEYKPSWEWRQQVEVLTHQLDEAKALLRIAQTEIDDNAQCCEVREKAERQLAETHAHLDDQRQATYQAVEREHTVKRKLAEVTKERDEAVEVARGLAECGPVAPDDIDWALIALNMYREKKAK